MPAWSEARYSASAIRSKYATPSADSDSGDAKRLREWFKRAYKEYKTDGLEKHRCIFHGGHSGRPSTGYIPEFGPVWKCKAHAERYKELVAAFTKGG